MELAIEQKIMDPLATIVGDRKQKADYMLKPFLKYLKNFFIKMKRILSTSMSENRTFHI